MYKPRKKGLDLMTKRSLAGWLFVLPFLLGFLVFVISPLYTSFMFSLNEQGSVTNTELLPQYESVVSGGNTFYVREMDENGVPLQDDDGNYIYVMSTDDNGNIEYEEKTNEDGTVTKAPKRLVVSSAEYYVRYLQDNGEQVYDEDGNMVYVMAKQDDGTMARKVVDKPDTKKTITYAGFSLYSNALTTNVEYLNNIGSSVAQLPTILFILIFSFLVANVLNSKFRGRTVVRAIFFMPVVTATGIAANLKQGSWEVARFNSTVSGALSNTSLDMVSSIKELLSDIEGLSPFVDFLTTSFDQLSNIVLMSGVQILIFLAALQTISPSLFEASDMEGASKWEAFWKITFPMVSPMILVSLMYTMIDVLTGQSNPVIAYLFSQTSGSMSLSDRMAMGWMYFAGAALLIVIVSAIISRFVYYENDSKR